MTTLVPTSDGTLFRYRDGGRSKMDEEGRCRMCLAARERRGERQLTRHHVVEQSWFRDQMARLRPFAPGFQIDTDEWTRLWKLRDAEANIVPLCNHCHRAVEDIRDPAARAMLRKVLGAVEVAFAIAVRGEDWFDRRYPRLGAERPVDLAAVAEA